MINLRKCAFGFPKQDFEVFSKSKSSGKGEQAEGLPVAKKRYKICNAMDLENISK